MVDFFGELQIKTCRLTHQQLCILFIFFTINGEIGRRIAVNHFQWNMARKKNNTPNFAAVEPKKIPETYFTNGFFPVWLTGSFDDPVNNIINGNSFRFGFEIPDNSMAQYGFGNGSHVFDVR